MSKKVFPEIVDMKSRIHKAYKILEEKGYFCGYAYWCCMTCGLNALPEDCGDTWVFFHKQDEDDLKEKGYCHLAWDGDAGVIMGAFGMVGILTMWNGSKESRMIIIHPSAKIDFVV